MNKQPFWVVLRRNSAQDYSQWNVVTVQLTAEDGQRALDAYNHQRDQFEERRQAIDDAQAQQVTEIHKRFPSIWDATRGVTRYDDEAGSEAAWRENRVQHANQLSDLVLELDIADRGFPWVSQSSFPEYKLVESSDDVRTEPYKRPEWIRPDDLYDD